MFIKIHDQATSVFLPNFLENIFQRKYTIPEPHLLTQIREAEICTTFTFIVKQVMLTVLFN